VRCTESAWGRAALIRAALWLWFGVPAGNLLTEPCPRLVLEMTEWMRRMAIRPLFGKKYQASTRFALRRTEERIVR
jgi:hypothetical protein